MISVLDESESEEGEEEEGEEEEGEEGQIVELTREDELKMMQDLEKKFIEEQSQLLQVLIDKDQRTRLRYR